MDAATRVQQVIAALADLSPQGGGERGGRRQIPFDWFRWLPLTAISVLAAQQVDRGFPYAPSDARPTDLDRLQQFLLTGPYDQPHAVPVDRAFAERLAAVDQIRAASGSVRLGWLFVAGTTAGASGQAIRVFEPLVTLKVRVRRGLLDSSLVAAGDVELNPMVRDPDGALQRALEVVLQGGAFDTIADVTVSADLLNRMPHLQQFARDAAAAAGVATASLVPVLGSPDALVKAEGLSVVAGVAAYVDTPSSPVTRASGLRTWASVPLVDMSALRTLYLGPEPSDLARVGGSETDAAEIESPFLLTPRQRQAVASSATAPLTVVSGAPGTGKSHAVVAMAVEAVARGSSVLIAARTDAAVDAVLDLLDRAPGPDPVVFGSNERRDALVERLTSGQVRPSSGPEIDEATATFRRAAAERAAARQELVDHLQAELVVEGRVTGRQRSLLDRLSAPDGGLDTIEDLLGAAGEPGGWWAGRRRRRAVVQLADRLGLAPQDLSLAEVAEALRMRRERDADGLVAPTVTESDARWNRLLKADDECRRTFGRLVDLESRSSERLDRKALVSLANLATALRSGRSARRAQLARLRASEVTVALPLWVGTLADIDDLLPPKPGLFDLVILDEASSIDQPLAAPALLRAERAVIAGDPKQLRHVSFLSDDRTQQALAAHGLTGDPMLASLLDVRRNSIFDVAAGSVPVLDLDEQFRSDPHLVDFVAKRLYGGGMQVATRTPRTESVDCVDVVRLEGKRDDTGAVRAEVDEVIVRLRNLRREGAGSVGVVTPFRAQADAIEAAVLATFSADDVEALDLRIGTVHAMQGNERDLVIASLGIGPSDSSSWRFVEDPHLFTVLVTRARRRFVVLLSADPPEGRLVADYLAQADAPPRPRRSADEVASWVGGIARGLELAGINVVVPYPAGRHLLDACVGDDIDFVGLESGVHPDGIDDHIDRHLSLRRGGWRMVECFESRWEGRVGELVIDLGNQLQCRRLPLVDQVDPDLMGSD